MVTGASGAGKTALVEALAGLALEGVSCHSFDSIGVPEAPDDGWATRSLREWLERLAGDPARVAVLEGSLRPSECVSALQRAGIQRWRIALVDCAAQTPRMDCWAAYLRGQADVLALPVIDTTARTVAQALPELIAHVRALQ